MNNQQQFKVMFKNVTYISKVTGKEVKSCNFYLVSDNGISIPVKPAFNSYYNVLKMFAVELPKDDIKE